MPTISPPRTTDQIVRLGVDLLRHQIEPTLPPSDAGRFVCVDVHTGAFEVDDNDLAALDRLHARLPGAESYLGRVGEESTFRLGLR